MRTLAFVALGLLAGCTATLDGDRNAATSSSLQGDDLTGVCAGKPHGVQVDFSRSDVDIITVYYCSNNDNKTTDWRSIGLIGPDGKALDLSGFGFKNGVGCGYDECHDHSCQQNLCRQKAFCDEKTHNDSPSAPSPTLAMVSISYCSVSNVVRDYSAAYPGYTLNGPECGTNKCTEHSCLQKLCKEVSSAPPDLGPDLPPPSGPPATSLCPGTVASASCDPTRSDVDLEVIDYCSANGSVIDFSAQYGSYGTKSAGAICSSNQCSFNGSAYRCRQILCGAKKNCGL